MKRNVLVLVSIIIIAALSGCSFEYDPSNVISYDNTDYYTSSISKQCFAANYIWDGNEASMNINLPDRIGKYKVEALGGFFGRGVPTPFCIILPDKLGETTSLKECGDILYGSTVHELHFTINIGANVKELHRVLFKGYEKYRDENGHTLYYKVVVSISCSKDNKTFYSKDGKLYRRADDSLVDEFFYYGESTDSL